MIKNVINFLQFFAQIINLLIINYNNNLQFLRIIFHYKPQFLLYKYLRFHLINLLMLILIFIIVVIKIIKILNN